MCTSNRSYGNFRPCPDVQFTKNLHCMIDRGARYKVYATIGTPHSSLNSSPSGATAPPAVCVCPLRGGDTDERGDFSHFSARGAARGVVSVSLSVRNRPWNIALAQRQCVWEEPGQGPGGPTPAAPIVIDTGNRCRLSSSRGTRSRSQLWRYANATLTVARGRRACACDCQGAGGWQSCTRACARPGPRACSPTIRRIVGARTPEERRRKMVPVGPVSVSVKPYVFRLPPTAVPKSYSCKWVRRWQIPRQIHQHVALRQDPNRVNGRAPEHRASAHSDIVCNERARPHISPQRCRSLRWPCHGVRGMPRCKKRGGVHAT